VKWDGRLVFGAANAELATAGIHASAFDDKLSCQVGSRSSMTLAALVLIAPLATQIPVQLIQFTVGPDNVCRPEVREQARVGASVNEFSTDNADIIRLTNRVGSHRGCSQ
jgi:hypothetical protein